MCFAALLLLLGGTSVTHASPYPQKVDKALDSNFEVELRNGYTYCVAPYLAKDNIYYAYETARKDSTDCIGYDWRYDVHGHISTVITTEGDQPDNFYLCMTDVASDDTSTYSYIQLKPCSVNNTRQIWKYNETTKQMVNQHTGYRLQENNWYLATSAKSSNLYDLKVTGREIIFALVPAPFTLAYQFNFHYPFEGKSYTQILGKDGRISQGALRYDPQTRQISKVMPDGYQYCLRSNMLGTTTDSEFVSFQRCPDSYGDGIVPNPLKWSITTSVSAQSHGRAFSLIIEDAKGNLFGVERSGGINIGTGYTIKPSAIASIPDVFKPWYVFQDGGEHYGRQTYVAGNYAGSLRPGICPAPGVFKDAIDGGNSTAALRLPGNFDLSRWLRRLWLIASHPGGTSGQSGVCGACLLHSIEMVLEMNRHGNNVPGDSVRPQYFTLNPAQTTMDSFTTRFRTLSRIFQMQLNNPPPRVFAPNDPTLVNVLSAQHFAGQIVSQLTGGSGLTVTPSIYYNRNRHLVEDDYRQMLIDLQASAVGTMFVTNFNLHDSQGTLTAGHAIALIRTRDGVHALQSRVPGMPLEDFSRETMAVINTPAQLETAMNPDPQRFPYLQEAVLFSLSPTDPEPAEVTFDQSVLSVGNCTNGGAAGDIPNTDHGAGSGLSFTVPENLFQCSDGRCDTSSKQAAANGDDDFDPDWPGQCELLEWVRGKWDWNGGSYWAKRLRTEQSCRAANRCRQGGACYRWSNTRDIGQCEHLWRNWRGQWKWFKFSYYTREKACRDANQCNGYGPCFRWHEGRPD
ncbi:hypothetical protein NFHSH190041_34280 [Shewanella sp. NFH-SH190041]|nr:hypothetical protein NFHSH190041_34280 [Shewanella sp. NFH-SH190041]